MQLHLFQVKLLKQLCRRLFLLGHSAICVKGMIAESYVCVAESEMSDTSSTDRRLVSPWTACPDSAPWNQNASLCENVIPPQPLPRVPVSAFRFLGESILILNCGMSCLFVTHGVFSLRCGQGSAACSTEQQQTLICKSYVCS